MKKMKCTDIAEKLDVKHVDDKPTTFKVAAAANENAKRHLMVTLTNPLGQMSQEQNCKAEIVEMKLLEALFSRMNDIILKCNDDATLTWIREAVRNLSSLTGSGVSGLLSKLMVQNRELRKGQLRRGFSPGNMDSIG